MLKTSLSVLGGAMAVAVAFSPATAPAAGVSLTDGQVICSDPSNIYNGSCNTVFDSRMELTNLTVAELNETVFQSCPNFPDGPYNRYNESSGQLLTPIDYATLFLSNTTTSATLSATSINDQLGTHVSSGVSVTIDGWSGNNQTVSITQTDPTLRSQILDLPGFDFVLFEKSSGGGAQVATLVCNLNMWYRTAGGSIAYGLKNFHVNHNINRITIGWVAGPSGFRSQTLAAGACEDAGTPMDPSELPLEKSLSYLIGTYKVTPTSPANPSNVTGCGVEPGTTPPVDVLASYCNPAEQNGTMTEGQDRPNACNPKGESGGTPAPSVTGVNGNASTCYFVASGTSVTFSPCPTY